jgi:hypothetical protein
MTGMAREVPRPRTGPRGTGAGHCRDRDEPPSLATLRQPCSPIRFSSISLQPGVHPSRRGHRGRGRGPRSSPPRLLADAALIGSDDREVYYRQRVDRQISARFERAQKRTLSD